jgi:hypothetical protein
MFGLEAGECNPFPGAGRRAAKRTGQLLDATSRVAASYALIAPGCHWSVPALEGIPTEYRFLGGLDAAARLGKVDMLDAESAFGDCRAHEVSVPLVRFRQCHIRDEALRQLLESIADDASVSESLKTA